MLPQHRSLTALSLTLKNPTWIVNARRLVLQSTTVSRRCTSRVPSVIRVLRKPWNDANSACINSKPSRFLALTFHGRQNVTRRIRSFSSRSCADNFCNVTANLRSSRTFTQQPSSEEVRGWNTRQVHVPIGGSGDATVEIFSIRQPVDGFEPEGAHHLAHHSNVSHSCTQDPTTKSLPSSTKRKNVLVIYLPPGPIPQTANLQPESDFKELLSNLAGRVDADFLEKFDVQVARLNYRLEKGPEQDDQEQDLRFPIPVHDVCMCFEAIVRQNRFSASVNRVLATPTATKAATKPEVYVVGSNIGGSLALTLALTYHENISAVAAIDPIVDWVGLDEIVTTAGLEISMQSSDTYNDLNVERSGQTPSSKRRRNTRNLSKLESVQMQCRAAQALIDLRTSLFRTPSGFFDQFASPILFLRAPGRDTPPWRSARPVPEQSSSAEDSETFGPYDDDWHAVHHNYVNENVLEQQEKLIPSKANTEADACTTGEQIVTDRNNNYDEDAASRPSSSLKNISQSSYLSSEVDTEVDATKSVKRRKTLRRWPSVRYPEEVLLPHVRIFSTELTSISADQDPIDKVDLAHVLHPQAKEMVDIMRRACFWGREKSLAEERVTIEVLDAMEPSVEEVNERANSDNSADGRISRVCKWLTKTINES